MKKERFAWSLIKPVEYVKRNYGRFFTELIISTELIKFPELIMFAELILFLMKDEGFDWFSHQASTQRCVLPVFFPVDLLLPF